MASKTPIYRRVQRFNNPGHAHFLTFSTYRRLPLLTNEVWRCWLGESVRRACDQLRFALWAYVFMPEHLHLLVRPLDEAYEISRFLHAVKRPVAERIIGALAERRSPLLKKLTVAESGKPPARFWQGGGGYDLNILSKEKALAKADYCHNNPVKRGLVRNADEWKWSSFRWLEMSKRKGEPLALDSWEPW